MKANVRIITLVTAVVSLTATIQAATNQFNVTAENFTAYTINGAPNPALPLVRGFTYTFNINVASVHPFYIKTAPIAGTGSQYNDGVSAQGEWNAIVTFDVPMDAPDTLYYQCSNHSAMNGPMNIVDPPSVIITELSVGSDVEIKSTGYDEDFLNLNILVSTNLATNVWTSASIQSNIHANGTNTTAVALPAGDAAFFQVQQGFFE